MEMATGHILVTIDVTGVDTSITEWAVTANGWKIRYWYAEHPTSKNRVPVLNVEALTDEMYMASWPRFVEIQATGERLAARAQAKFWDLVATEQEAGI